MNICEITSTKKCMSCGGCSYACPINAIEMQFNKQDGFYRPNLNKERCVECGKCLRVCPATNQEETSLLGIYKNIYLAHSTDAHVRHDATSGGVINSLARYLIDKDIVEGILMMKYDQKSEVEMTPLYVTKENKHVLEERPRDFASRYVSYPVLNALRKDRNTKRIAIVGTPCQLRSLSLNVGEFSNIYIFKIGITCSGGMSYKATEEYKRIKHLESAKMYYRGDGWPGKNSLILDRQKIEFVHTGSLFERMFSSQVFKNPGCRQCKDHFAEKADISFCDFWNEEESKTESEGNSCVIIRSKEAQDIFERMQQDSYIDVIRELSEFETVNTQMHVLKAKKGDMHKKAYYRFFIKLIDIIFKYKLYKKFSFKTYQQICKYYWKICQKVSF